MTINVRTKGQTGEREICKILNDVYAQVYSILNLPYPEKDIAQRNQNQSAVGGCDISNTCNYAIEVKRQEQLSINTWWNQCVISAKEVNKFPVLLYRQNSKKWKCIMYVNPLRTYAEEELMWVRAEMSIDDFCAIFKEHAIQYIKDRGDAS